MKKLELVGVREAAEILEMSPQRVSQLKAVGAMPEPVAELRCGTIWLKGDVERAARERNG